MVGLAIGFWLFPENCRMKIVSGAGYDTVSRFECAWPRMKKKTIKDSLLLLAIAGAQIAIAADEAIDASDPTKIYSYAGGGIKFTDYTNDETMTEIRANGNIGLSPKDMVMFELGYGFHDGDLVPGSNEGLTNARLRWFHLTKMDGSVVSGYRGWGTQVDAQIAGELKGTDGQNTIALGYMAAFGINEKWSFYLPLNFVNTWDKKFEHYNGAGLGMSPMLAFTPGNWWNGAFLQIWPNYTWFVSGELENEGAGNIDINLGGSISPTLIWTLTAQKNVDIDLRSFRRGPTTGLTNDYNFFFNVNKYF